MADCATVPSPPVSALGSRASVLNRTIIVSKKSSRRPGLPEVLSPTTTKTIDSANGTTISSTAQETMPMPAKPPQLIAMPSSTPQHADHSPKITMTNGQAKEGNSTAQPQNKMPPLEKMAKPASLVPALQQLLNESNLGQELNGRIMEMAKTKQNEWNFALDKSEKDKVMRSQLFTLKLRASNKTCEKAMQLFQICEEQGIDLDAVLGCRPNALAQLRLRQHSIAVTNIGRSPASTPTTECRRSPASDFEDAIGSSSKLAQEKEALQAEVHSLEENYSNLFKLYERMRLNCVNMKDTEQQLRNELEQMGKKYASLYAMYAELLNEAQRKLDGAQMELQRMEKEHDEKTLGIRLALKRAQIQVESLENALKTKSKENDELHGICNQLIEARDAAIEDENDDSSGKENT